MANSGGNNVMARLKGRCMSEKVKLHAAMIALQFGYAGFHIVSRAALNMGVSKVVYPIYRNVIAFLLLGPCAYFVEKNERPALTLSFLIQFFLLALCGITANQGFYLLGLYYTSPTFASAIQNSVPAITFVMAASLRFETVNVRRKDGIAKIIGTMACVGGATVITLYKGPPLSDLWQSAKMEPLNYFKTLQGQQHHISSNSENWTLGCIYLLGNCLTWSAWIVLQAPVLRKYPARLSVTSFTCFFGVIQFLIIAAFVERDIQHWKIASTEELFTILYAGCVASGIAFSVQIWCIDRGGPVFVAVYQPVQTLLVAIMASLLLGEKFYLGAVFGAVIIVGGLYLVLWGKSKEKKLALMETKPCSTSREECSAVIISGNISDHKNDDPALTQPLLNALKRFSPAFKLAEP